MNNQNMYRSMVALILSMLLLSAAAYFTLGTQAANAQNRQGEQRQTERAGVAAFDELNAQPGMQVAAAEAQDEASRQEDPGARVPRGCPRWAKRTIINKNSQTPPTPAPFIASVLQKNTKGQSSLVRKYGQGGTDLQFADSFDLGRCRLCYAALEFDLKKEGGQFDNDGLHLWLEPDTIPAVTPPPLFSTSDKLWTIFQNGRPVIEWGKLWTNTAQASAQRPISELNSYIFNSQLQTPAISVYLQDDTSITSARLTLWYY